MRRNLNLFLLFQVLIQVIYILSDHKVLTACSEGYVEDGGKCYECGLTYYSPNVRRRRAPSNETLDEKSGSNNKIVGGVVANANSWPSQVLLYIKGSKGTYLCGGTLIKRNVVLTAAHCASLSYIASNYQVYLGAQDRSKLVSPGVIRTTVSKVIVHSGYKSNTLQNDIAMLILSQPVTLTANIQLACLPSSSNTFPSVDAESWIVGWGTTSYQGVTSGLLQNVKIKVLNPTTDCRNYYPTYWSSQVCAGNINGGQDTCQGDSGGPLYVKGSLGGKTRYILAGVTSYGNGCALRGWPGIYTRTAAYISWITANSI